MLSASDRVKFENLLRDAAVLGRDSAGIGTYKEKSLHYILKNFFCPNKDFHETSYKGYIADIMKDGYITEIQSSSLSGMKGKLDAFLEENCVRIVFPIIEKRNIVWVDPESGDMKRSPRSVSSENIYVLICQLIYILDYLRDPSLTVTAVTLCADDYRLLNGRGRDRKIGAEKLDCVPTELIDIFDLVFPDDLARFIPEKLPEAFTRDEFSKATRLRGRALWAVLKVMLEMRVIVRLENDGRRYRYARNVLINPLKKV